MRLKTVLLTAAAGIGLGLVLAGAARAQAAAQTLPAQPKATEPVIPTRAETPAAQTPLTQAPVTQTPVTQAPAAGAATCPVSGDSLTLAGDGLVRSKAAVAQNRLNILAIGSSSIEGVGASRAELGFVPLLQSDLRERLPDVAVNVWNRGIGGETAHETVNRLQAEIERFQPDLVIWQLGTNDVLRARPWNDVAADLRRGEAILSAAKVDVLLIDPQRLPENGANFRGKNTELGEAARLIALEGNRVGYAVQRRFDAMQGWTRLNRGGVGPDDLHMNDDGYACWAAITAEGLAAALR